MRQARNKSFLGTLRANALKYEHYNINAIKETWIKRIWRNIYLYAVAITLTFFLNQGFSSDFISFLSTVLSILIGLFLTSLIFALDKFYEPIEEKVEDLEISINKNESYRDYRISIKHLFDTNSRKKLWHNQAYNYVLKYTFITGHNIVLSIYTLLLLYLSSLFPDFMGIDVQDYYFDFSCINLESVGNLLLVISICTQRFLILYWSLKIFRNTLFVISSMVNFMTTKINRATNQNI